VLAHLGSPEQNPRGPWNVCVCVSRVGRQGSLALAGSLSRRRKTLIQNRGLQSPLASSGTPVTLSMWWPYSPIVSDLPCHWVLGMFCWRRGTTGATSSHVKNLTAQTWRSTHGWSFGIQPHRPLRTPRSSRCRLQFYRCVSLSDIAQGLSTLLSVVAFYSSALPALSVHDDIPYSSP